MLKRKQIGTIDGAGCAEYKHLTKGNIHEGAQCEIRYLQFMDMINIRKTQTAVV
jgi:hypothetical protein